MQSLTVCLQRFVRTCALLCNYMNFACSPSAVQSATAAAANGATAIALATDMSTSGSTLSASVPFSMQWTVSG